MSAPGYGSHPQYETVFKWGLADFRLPGKQWLEFDYENGEYLQDGWYDDDFICEDCREERGDCQYYCFYCHEMEQDCECDICVECGDLDCRVCCPGDPNFCTCDYVGYCRADEEGEDDESEEDANVESLAKSSKEEAGSSDSTERQEEADLLEVPMATVDEA